MKRTLRQIAILAVALATTQLPVPAANAVAGGEDPEAILARSDTIRNPQLSFVVDVKLISYEDGERTDSTTVTTHSRREEGSGQFLSLVYIDRPARDAGKIILRNGNLLWFFDPASKASVRLSPRQRLLGNASNGDVITVNLALDYDVELVGEEQISDGNRNPRQTYRLHLKSHNEIAPYHEIEYWVDKDTYQPIKGQFYSQSGRLLKVAWYRGWERVLGERRPTEIVIADGFDHGDVTVMKMSNFRPRELPQSWFSKSWLPRFRKQ